MYEEKTSQQLAKKEKELLSALLQAEDLAEKKTRVYSRLLTEISLAKKMEELANRHAERKQSLQALISGEKPNEDTMAKTNSGGEEE